MENCLFCKIANNKMNAEVIYEDEHAAAFLDIFPRSKGHAMVVPKVHAQDINDLPDSEIGPVFMAVKKVAELLKNQLNADGFTIGINHGKVSGQVVEHLHIHIIPRFEGDGGGSIHSVVDNPPQESLEEIKKRITGL